jgi:NitT/TauT family transport system substrate-binding protein
MNMRFWISQAAIAGAALLGAFGAAQAQAPTKLHIAGPAPVLSATDSVVWYAVPATMGYYKEENLDVSFNVSSGLPAALQAVQTGSSPVGVTNPELVMQAREQGGSVKAFFTMRRAGGVAVAVLPDSPIKTLADLKGKTIGGVSWGGGGSLYLTKVLADMGIGMGDYSRVVVGNGAAAATALRGKQVDAVSLWDSAFATIENTGVKMRFINITGQENLGSNVIVATDATIKDNPDVLTRFCRAVAKSFYFARISPENATRIFLKVNPTMRAPNQSEDEAYRNNFHVFKAWLTGATNGVPLGGPMGAIDPGVWKFTQDFYKSTGMLKAEQPPTASYTTQFLDQCNAFDRPKVAQQAKGYAAK